MRKSQRPPQPLQSVLEHMALGAHIEAHEAGTTGTEHLTVVEGKVGLIDEEVNEFLMIESQVTAVEPDEEGGLGT